VFKYLRIAILLTVLLIVAGNKWLTGDRLNSWEKPLWVTIYPIPAEPSPEVERYVTALSADDFDEIGRFIRQQARRHGRDLETPLVIQLADPMTSKPPPLPLESNGLGVAWWSLKMRWWDFRYAGQAGLAPDDIRMFVLYHEARDGKFIERSVGIRNGGYGIVNAVASRQRAAHNRIVITHELLHVLGASDKYDLRTGQPIAAEGVGDPNQSPLYPQRQAEIMAGRVAVTANRWRMAGGLKECVIGDLTAREINWLPVTSGP
jgi:hypothetical protein